MVSHYRTGRGVFHTIMGSNILRRKRNEPRRYRSLRNYGRRHRCVNIYGDNDTFGALVNEKELREGDDFNVFV